MKTLTLRNFSPDLTKTIRRKASKEGTSLTKAVVHLLEEGQRIRKKKGGVLYHDLDALAGSWTRAEGRAFEKALRSQRRIDPDLWK